MGETLTFQIKTVSAYERRAQRSYICMFKERCMGARWYLQPPECFDLSHIDEVVQAIRKVSSLEPRIGLILGSGLAEVVEHGLDVHASISYDDLPYWPAPSVLGHPGRLFLGHWAGQPVMLMQGRAHYYEGYTMAQVTLPVRVMQRMGVEILIVTNAAGGLNPEFEPGDLMLIRDHINLVGMVGLSPLRGPNLDEFGPRFPSMRKAYDPDLRSLAREVAQELGDIPLHEGVYVGLAGPQFETPAELKFLHTIGGDAVGMSTVAEVTVARHGGTRVLGISGISNKATWQEDLEPTHEEVLEAGRIMVPRMARLIEGVLQRL